MVWFMAAQVLVWIVCLCFRHLGGNGRKYVAEEAVKGQEGKKKEVGVWYHSVSVKG